MRFTENGVSTSITELNTPTSACTLVLKFTGGSGCAPTLVTYRNGPRISAPNSMFGYTFCATLPMGPSAVMSRVASVASGQ